MEIKVPSDVLAASIRTIVRLAPPEQGHLTLEVKGSNFYLHSVGALSKARVQVAAKAKGDGAFSVSLDAIQTAVKGRSELTLEQESGNLQLTSGRYKASLPTFDPVIEQERLSKKVKGISIDADTAQWLKASATKVELQHNDLVSSFMPLGILATKRGTYVACYDSFHMSVAASKSIKGDYELLIPIKSMQTVLDVFSVSDFELQITESALLCGNPQILVEFILPDTSGGDLPTVKEAVKRCVQAFKSDGTALTIARAELLSFLDNARAVAVRERSEIEVKAKAKETTLRVSTANGDVTATIPSKGKSQNFKVDLINFESVVRKADDEVVLNVVQDMFLTCAAAGTSYVVALNQDD